MNKYLSVKYTVAAGLMLISSAALASGMATLPVTLGPRIQATLKDLYGPEEGPKLQSYVSESIGKALSRGDGRCNLHLEVVIDDAMPSHPTPRQQSDAIDPVHSRSLGGATLTGRIFSGTGQELTKINYKNYPQDFSLMSRSFDPWADAHVAMDVFSDQLVSACRRYTAAPSTAK